MPLRTRRTASRVCRRWRTRKRSPRRAFHWTEGKPRGARERMRRAARIRGRLEKGRTMKMGGDGVRSRLYLATTAKQLLPPSTMNSSSAACSLSSQFSTPRCLTTFQYPAPQIRRATVHPVRSTSSQAHLTSQRRREPGFHVDNYSTHGAGVGDGAFQKMFLEYRRVPSISHRTHSIGRTFSHFPRSASGQP